jgi:hypothetical protein
MIRPLVSASLIAATALLFAVQMPGSSTASTLTYDLTLTPLCTNCGPESGTGSFTITTPAVGSSGNLTEGHGLTSMNFQIDGLNFTMNSSSEVGYYYNGSTLVLDNIGYTGIIGNFELTGVSLGGYYFGDSAPGGYVYDTNGSIGLALAATPLPGTWSMLLIGFAGLGFVAYRAAKNGSAAAAPA